MPDTTITQYAEPLFYFFLRKTGSGTDAEDLAADVLLDTLAALRQGRDIVHLHAWVWRVARSRYARWAEEKRRALIRIASGEEAEQLPDDLDAEAALIRREEMALLRRELAFIRRDHRELIVAFYIEDRSVADIARSLRLPEGTVKARLHRCRKMLKEGMQMAREFGKRSYKPENMDFVTSGNMPGTLPNSAMERALSRNILLEASENPSTIEELSMALGVAAPYMEEEVQLLLKATLLKRVGDRYVTDFYIMDGDTAKLLRRTLRDNAGSRTEIVRSIALDALGTARAIHPDNDRKTDNELLWWLLPHVHEVAMFSDPHYVSDFPERSCGKDETWGVEGFEKVEAPDWERCWMSRCVNSCGDNAVGLYQYDHEDEAMWQRIGVMNGRQAALLGSMLRGKRPLSSLTDTERGAWQSIEGRFAHEEKGYAVSDIVVLPAQGLERLNHVIRNHPRYGELEAAVSNDFACLLQVFASRTSAVLREQLNYVASNEICNSRMMVINDCLADGMLRLPEEPGKSTVGMWIELR